MNELKIPLIVHAASAMFPHTYSELGSVEDALEQSVDIAKRLVDKVYEVV